MCERERKRKIDRWIDREREEGERETKKKLKNRSPDFCDPVSEAGR